MNSPFKQVSANSPDKFFGYLVSFRQSVKLTHWSQPDKSDATHLALDEIYEDLEDFIDSIIEKYQGIHGLVEFAIPTSKCSTNPLGLVEEAYRTIENDRSIFKESFLQNIIDEIQAVLAKGLYKLKFVRSRA